ncbi:MAG: hypothetical protein ACJ8BW_30205 [Ktedonobacteraceae bacterium]|jgi:hypothetical protein
MAGYIVRALSLDQNGPTSQFTIAVSVTDDNGLGVQNLSVRNFAVHTITSETHAAIAELQSAGVPGYYRLLLRTEPQLNSGECIFALIVTIHRHIAGRMPGDAETGNTMVKVRVV